MEYHNRKVISGKVEIAPWIRHTISKSVAGYCTCANGLLVWLDTDRVATHAIRYVVAGGIEVQHISMYKTLYMYNTGKGFRAELCDPVEFGALSGLLFFLVGYEDEVDIKFLLEVISNPLTPEQVKTMTVVL